MDDRNPYHPDTPEWQLFENMTSSFAQSRAFASDAAHATQKSQAAREKADRFKAALDSLGANKDAGHA